jgi:DNA-binding response OmpR family regulator
LESSKTVLVAERDDVIRGLLAHILQRQGFQVHTASDGLQAAALLGETDYDAIVIAATDGHDGGLHLISGVAETAPQRLPRVIVTTTSPGQLDGLSDLPLHGIVKKPVEIGDFVELVRSCTMKNAV